MELKKIQDADVENKKVLMRVDFNVAVEKGKIKEIFKIAAIKETVNYLLGKGVKVALISHLGRPAAVKTLAGKPEGKVNPAFSLEQMKDSVENILGKKVKFIGDCIGEKVKHGLENLSGSEVLLLENVRFYEGEESNNENFTKKLAEDFDIFVNDAFSVCHRDQASVTGIAKVLPRCAGFWLQKEIENLDRAKDNPVRPAVAIIGGAKIETKLPLIHMFERKYEKVLVGGKIAIEAQNADLAFSSKVVLPDDYAEGKYDIGLKTIEKYKKIIIQAKTIVWNGSMGKFEKPPYDLGTQAILEAVISSGAFCIVGGGESVQFLEEQGLLSKISFVSTGGGAMLEYLSGNDLPGIEVLKE